MAKAQQGGVRGSTARVTTLKRRSEFQRVRKGRRWGVPAFVLEAKAREQEAASSPQGARFGFTITRAVGKAVERNRIRRRLKAAIAGVAAAHARQDFDYVLIARRPALTSPFDALVAELVDALARIHRSPQQARRAGQTGKNRAG
jgi:ribonuclease P protein component